MLINGISKRKRSLKPKSSGQNDVTAGFQDKSESNFLNNETTV